jgi:hypothetical protein
LDIPLLLSFPLLLSLPFSLSPPLYFTKDTPKKLHRKWRQGEKKRKDPKCNIFLPVAMSLEKRLTRWTLQDKLMKIPIKRKDQKRKMKTKKRKMKTKKRKNEKTKKRKNEKTKRFAPPPPFPFRLFLFRSLCTSVAGPDNQAKKPDD